MLEHLRSGKARAGASLLALALFTLPAATGCAGGTPQPVSAETSTSAFAWPDKLDHASTPETQRSAVDGLFEVMHMQQVLDASLDAAMKAQLEGNPKIRPFEPVLRKFMAKYLSIEGLREPMTRLYVARFSELEIVQLTAFYRTPLGQRMLAEVPKIIEEGGKIGMNLVKEHMDELIDMVRQHVEQGGGRP
ncbi:MAG: DUF2059 domain-containing protein [Byssovorax sp.]